VDRETVRVAVWDRLRNVARPDSRFHLDFSMFIPDYPGSERIPAALRELPFTAGGGPVFVTPDNNLETLRAELLRVGRPLLVTTYGILRGFVFFRPGGVPEDSIDFAASLDGMERFGTPLDLEGLRGLGRLDFLVTGASAVSRDGIRFGKGHGYFDVEWALLRDLGAVDEDTPVVACVDDTQYVEEDLPARDTDTLVDWIVTPTRSVRVARTRPKPAGVRWDVLDPHLLATIPPLQELHAARSDAKSGAPESPEV
jgi:5-formyltetrahydrofolate cyclo-ligase